MSQRNNFTNRQAIFDLVSKYEDMCEAGSVAFSKEKAYYQLIDYFEEEYLVERALEVVDSAINQHPCSGDFHIRKAQLLINCQREELAMAALDQAEVFSPFDPEISLLRSEALASLELFSDALSILESMKHEVDSSTLSNVFLYEAMVYEQMEEYERMFYALKAAVEEDHSNTEALKRLWICVELSKKYKESIALHEKLIDKDPYSYLAWYNLGAAYSYFGDYEEAIAAYEYAFIINERFELAYRDCAEMCFELQKYSKALQCYQEVLEHFEPDAFSFQRIGECYQNLKKYAIAKTFYEKAIRLDPFLDEVFFHLGECYSREEKWKTASSFFLKAINLEDRREEYYAGLAEVYYQMGNYNKAAPLFREATEIAPEQSEYWIQHASFLMEINMHEQALDVLDDAEEHAVGTELQYCRAACLFSLGRRKEALYVLGNALDEDFEMHDALFSLLPMLQDDSEVQAIIATYQPL